MKPARRLSVTAFAGLTQRVSHSAGRYYIDMVALTETSADRHRYLEAGRTFLLQATLKW